MLIDKHFFENFCLKIVKDDYSSLIAKGSLKFHYRIGEIYNSHPKYPMFVYRFPEKLEDIGAAVASFCLEYIWDKRILLCERRSPFVDRVRALYVSDIWDVSNFTELDDFNPSAWRSFLCPYTKGLTSLKVVAELNVFPETSLLELINQCGSLTI